MDRFLTRRLSIAGAACLLLPILGCMTPVSQTRSFDDTYKGKIASLNLVLVPGHFPEAEAAIRASGLDKRDWYLGVAARMQQNFAHNGVEITTHVPEVFPTGFENPRIQMNGVPTLVIKFEKIYVQDRKLVSLLNARATLFAPGRGKPIWDAMTGAVPYRAADEMSLRTLNDLAKLRLVSLRFAEAETLDGHKNISLIGGLMTK